MATVALVGLNPREELKVRQTVQRLGHPVVEPHAADVCIAAGFGLNYELAQSRSSGVLVWEAPLPGHPRCVGVIGYDDLDTSLRWSILAAALTNKPLHGPLPGQAEQVEAVRLGPVLDLAIALCKQQRPGLRVFREFSLHRDMVQVNPRRTISALRGLLDICSRNADTVVIRVEPDQTRLVVQVIAYPEGQSHPIRREARLKRCSPALDWKDVFDNV